MHGYWLANLICHEIGVSPQRFVIIAFNFSGKSKTYISSDTFGFGSNKDSNFSGEN